MALKLKSFAQPDLLKSIKPESLLKLLASHQLFFDMKGFVLPTGNGEEFDYLALAGVLAQPDEDMPSEMVDALHIIGNFSGDEYFDDLLELARRELIEVDGEATAPDLATRLYLHDPKSWREKNKNSFLKSERRLKATGQRIQTLPSESLNCPRIYGLSNQISMGTSSARSAASVAESFAKTPLVRFVSWCNTANPASVSRAAKARSLPAHSSGPRRRTL